jgi:hypothetical protein
LVISAATAFALLDKRKDALDWLENAVDERLISPMARHREPLVEGSKGEPPPWSKGGVSCPAREREAGRPGLPGARWKGETRSGFPLQIDCGFINYPFLNEYDPYLANIRGDERFKKLMERVRYKAEHFEE